MKGKIYGISEIDSAIRTWAIDNPGKSLNGKIKYLQYRGVNFFPEMSLTPGKKYKLNGCTDFFTVIDDNGNPRVVYSAHGNYRAQLSGSLQKKLDPYLKEEDELSE